MRDLQKKQGPALGRVKVPPSNRSSRWKSLEVGNGLVYSELKEGKWRGEGGEWYGRRLEPVGLGRRFGFSSEHTESPLKGLVTVNRRHAKACVRPQHWPIPAFRSPEHSLHCLPGPLHSSL